MIKVDENGTVTYRGVVIGMVTGIDNQYRTSSPAYRLPSRTFRTLRDAVAYLAN